MNVRGFASLAKMHRFRMDEHRRKAAEVEAGGLVLVTFFAIRI